VKEVKLSTEKANRNLKYLNLRCLTKSSIENELKSSRHSTGMKRQVIIQALVTIIKESQK